MERNQVDGLLKRLGVSVVATLAKILNQIQPAPTVIIARYNDSPSLSQHFKFSLVRQLFSLESVIN